MSLGNAPELSPETNGPTDTGRLPSLKTPGRPEQLGPQLVSLDGTMEKSPEEKAEPPRAQEVCGGACVIVLGSQSRVQDKPYVPKQ